MTSSSFDRLRAALSDRYDLEHELGAGGMATVYLAADRKHDRKVAIKVLKPELAAVLGAERFVQEIKTTAALSHPHILPLFDSGEAGGFLYYVMPYLQGETIRQKLDRETQFGVEEAIRITAEVADALDYAHSQGVIHRDIKPENILLHAGRPMVMDFGIALAVSAAAGGRMTETGLSLGTPHYMSPEQATADKSLTSRSDIYSLATVLYEMLAGDPPHTASSAQAIIMKIVTEEAPPVTARRKAVPPNVAAALAKALEKLPADRFESAKAFGEALANPAFVAAGRPGHRPAPSSRRSWFGDPRSIAAILLGVAGGVLAWTLGRSAGQAGPVAYDVGLPDTAGLMTWAQEIGFAVAPAGDFVVYETVRRGRSELWYRSLLDATVRRIAGSDDATQPAISPDGKRVAFFRTGGDGWTVEILPVEGGTATTLGRGAGSAKWLRWPTDGRLYVLQRDGTEVRRFDTGGGPVVTAPISYCVGDVPVPGDDRLLCGGGGRKWGYLASPGSTVAERLLWQAEDSGRVYGSSFRLIDQRYLTWVSQGGDLLAAPVNFETGRVGRAVRMASGLATSDYTGLGSYAVAASGTLVHVEGDNKTVGHLVRVRDEGTDTLPVGAAAFHTFTYSPDGRRLAAVVEGLEGVELRIYDLSSGQQMTWLRRPAIGRPVWSPAGDRLVFTVGDSLFVGSPDRAGPPEFLAHSAEGLEMMTWTPDDRVFGVRWEPNAAVAVRLDRRPVTFDSLFSDNAFVWPSPDGRWIAYTNLAFTEAWLEPLPRDGRRYQVAAGNLGEIQWRSPFELAVSIMSGPLATMERITVTPGSTPPVGNRRRWVDLPDFRDTDGPSFAVAPGGGIVYLRGAVNRPVAYFRVTRNWVAAMKRAVDAANR